MRPDDGVALHAAALASGFEGVIGKRMDSRYESRQALGVVAEGQADADRGLRDRRLHAAARARARRWARSSSGYWDEDKLRYASHVGSGFDDARSRDVKARLDALERKTCPFAEKPELNAPDDLGRARSRRRGELPQWTDDGALRAPVFVRLRDDVDAKSERARRPLAPGRCHASPCGARRTSDGIDEVVAQLDNAKALSPSPSARTASSSPTSTASTGRRTRRCSSPRSPSATCCATSRRSRRTC